MPGIKSFIVGIAIPAGSGKWNEYGTSGDLLAFHLRETLKHIGSITGQVEVDTDILGSIFSKFCVGK